MRAHTVYEQVELDQPGTPARIHTYPHRDDLTAMEADIRAAKAQAMFGAIRSAAVLAHGGCLANVGGTAAFGTAHGHHQQRGQQRPGARRHQVLPLRAGYQIAPD